MIISYDNDSRIFDMHIMMKMISRYYRTIITQMSLKYQNINSQTNDILSRYFDKPQYCTLVFIWKAMYFEFQSYMYGSAWQRATIAFVEKYICLFF